MKKFNCFLNSIIYFIKLGLIVFLFSTIVVDKYRSLESVSPFDQKSYAEELCMIEDDCESGCESANKEEVDDYDKDSLTPYDAITYPRAISSLNNSKISSPETFFVCSYNSKIFRPPKV